MSCPTSPYGWCHAGYRHAVFVATLSEANRLRPDWNLGDEETPELDSYRSNFVDFANFFADDMFGTEFVHRRIKTREIFDLASSAYVDMRRAAHRAKAAADAAASSDSDDATTTPTMTTRRRRRPGSSPLPKRPRAQASSVTAPAGPAPLLASRRRLTAGRPTQQRPPLTQRPCSFRRQRASRAPSPSTSRPAARSRAITQVARLPRRLRRSPPT